MKTSWPRLSICVALPNTRLSLLSYIAYASIGVLWWFIDLMTCRLHFCDPSIIIQYTLIFLFETVVSISVYILKVKIKQIISGNYNCQSKSFILLLFFKRKKDDVVFKSWVSRREHCYGEQISLQLKFVTISDRKHEVDLNW